MLLVALLMSLDIVKRTPSSAQSDPDLVAKRDALKSAWIGLQSRLGGHREAPSVLDASAENLSRQNREALILALKTEAERLAKVAFSESLAGETVKGAAARGALEESLDKLGNVCDQIENLTKSTEQLERKVKAAEASVLALKRDKDRIWVIPENSRTAKEPLIVSVLPDSFILEELDSRESKRLVRTADVQSDIAKLLEGFAAVDHYAVLYFRPSTLPDFVAVKIAVSEGEGFEVGYDVVEDGKVVSFASNAGADAVPDETEKNQEPKSSADEGGGVKVSVEDLEARGEPISCGSGFYVSDDGFFVTNHHVVAGSGSCFVGLKGLGWRRATLVAVNEQHDLALLRVQAASVPVSILHSDGVKLGQTAATVGFPNIQLQGILPKLSKGEISGLAGLQDDPESFQISLPVQPGNSGGVLFDAQGNAIGVVNARINQAAAFATTGTHAENVNYAVKSGVLLSWLVGLGMPELQLKTGKESAASFEDAVEQVQKSVGLILAYPE